MNIFMDCLGGWSQGNHRFTNNGYCIKFQIQTTSCWDTKICSSTLPSTPNVYKWYTYVYTNKVCQCMPIHSTNLISLVPPCHFFKEQHEIKMGNPGVPICVWSVSRFKTSLCFNSLRFWRSLWITWLLATFSPQPQMIKVPVAASGCQRHNSRSWKEVHL